jgi:hypothetical protein
MPTRTTTTSPNSKLVLATEDGYTVPFVHVRVPERRVNTAFWATLAGATLLGAIDLPLAALVGAGVIIARHRQSGD